MKWNSCCKFHYDFVIQGLVIHFNLLQTELRHLYEPRDICFAISSRVTQSVVCVRFLPRLIHAGVFANSPQLCTKSLWVYLAMKQGEKIFLIQNTCTCRYIIINLIIYEKINMWKKSKLILNKFQFMVYSY